MTLFNPMVLNIIYMQRISKSYVTSPGLSQRILAHMYNYVHGIWIYTSNSFLNLEDMIPFPHNQKYSSTSCVPSKWNPVIPNKNLTLHLISRFPSSPKFTLIQNPSTFLPLHSYHSFPNHYTAKLDFCNGLLS